MNGNPAPRSDSPASAPKSRAFVLAFAAGALALVGWVAWWGIALSRIKLPGAERTWMVFPAFGADFWSQADLAARLWHQFTDPYSSEAHLFHYPPLVIRLFLWTPYFSMPTALRIWIVTNVVLVVLGTLTANRLRPALGLRTIPWTLALALTLWSFPVVFQLERANFDLITLAVLLLALPLFARDTKWSQVAAGCLLAIGPWVKLYPGVLGLGLLGLRRYRAFAGFVAAGLAIGLAMPGETLRSFQILRLAIARIDEHTRAYPYGEWSHSLSGAWIKIGQALPEGKLASIVQHVPGSVVGGISVLLAIGFVCARVHRSQNAALLTYPLLLWMLAVATCAPIISNDYSLAFLPLAAVAVTSARDPWGARLSLLASCAWLQPLAFPIPALLLLVLKLLGLLAVGWSIVRRANELEERSGTLPS